MENLIIKINNKEHKVKVEETAEGKIRVHLNKEIFEVETREDIANIHENINKTDLKTEGETVITAPLPGIVASINVKKGQKVNSDAILLKLIAMKMENEILSPKDGTVKQIKVKKNDNVNKGDVLVVIG